MNISNQNNVKLKAQYVIDNIDALTKVYGMSSNSKKLVTVLKRDGIKCHCCGQTNIYYRINEHKVLEAYIHKDNAKDEIRLTVDHDYLASLGGINHADNYHALCEKCNTLREDRFAEYPEFKSWYDNRRSGGKVVNKAAHRNFCPIDFNVAIKEDKNHMVFPNGVPQIMKDHMRKVLKKQNTLKGAFTSKAYRRVPLQSLNEFLTELVYEEASNKLGFEIERNVKVLTILSSKKLEGLKDKEYIGMMIANFKNEINKLVVKHRNHQVQEVRNEAVHKNTFWNRLRTAFKVLLG